MPCIKNIVYIIHLAYDVYMVLKKKVILTGNVSTYFDIHVYRYYVIITPSCYNLCDTIHIL